MWYYNPDHPLRRLFAGVTENTFMATLGVGDPKIVDYISVLLAKFIHIDAIHRLKDSQGKQLEEVADMVREAESLPSDGNSCREYHRHIGDFALFWTGLFPESLHRKRPDVHKDFLLDYTEQGKRSYYIASTYEDDPYAEEAPVLRRLSVEFELCAYGLNHVRKELDRTGKNG